jgi:stringent starvation protein B
MKEKLDTLDNLLNTPQVTTIHLDATHHGVEVPAHCKGTPALILSLSRRFGMELSLDPDAIRGELSFSGRVSKIVIPWEALWGVSKGETQVVWEESMPDVVRAAWLEHKSQVDEYNREQEKAKADRQAKIRRSGLKLV